MSISWAKRVLGVTASEIPKILGVDAFDGPESAWERKIAAREGRIHDEIDNPDVERGVALEAAIRTWASKRLQLKIESSKTYERTISGLVCIASPDGEIEDGRLLEIKCPRYGNQPRDGYLAQIQWQLMVTRKQSAVLAVFADGELELYPVNTDADQQKEMLQAAIEWWGHVLCKTRPAPRGPQSSTWLKDNLAQASDEYLESDALADAARRYRSASDALKAAEAAKDTAAAELQSAIAERKGACGSWGKATWATVKRTTTDWEGVAKKLGATEADVAQYVKTSTHRRLTVKVKEE